MNILHYCGNKLLNKSVVLFHITTVYITVLINAKANAK